MKIAYRIITPVLAAGALVIGVMLKLFHFALGAATEELSQLTQLLQAFNVKTNFEFSVVDNQNLMTGMVVHIAGIIQRCTDILDLTYEICADRMIYFSAFLFHDASSNPPFLYHNYILFFYRWQESRLRKMIYLCDKNIYNSAILS